MLKRLSILLAALALASTLVAAPVPPPAYALENARIVSMSGPVIESGTLVMRDGRIAAVGVNVVTPADAVAINARGWTLYPGFIDAHSSLGMPKPQEKSGREVAERRERGDPTPGLQANLRASTLYAHDSDSLDAYRRVGVTVAAIAPQNGILRGQSTVIALSDGNISELVLTEPWAQHIGYEPFSRQRNDYPGTHMGVLAKVRQSFSDAVWYQIAWKRYAQTPAALERPTFDESLAALGAAANNEQQVVFSAWSDNAILRAVGLADELSLDAIVSGAIDGWRVADLLAQRKLPVLVSLDHRPRRDPSNSGRQAPGGLMLSPGAEDKKDARANAARLHDAGVRFAFTSEELESTVKFLPNLRATVKAGLPEQAALEALTVTPATFLGLNASLGTLEPGKVANVVAVDGNLFDDGRVAATWIDGRLYESTAESKKTWEEKVEDGTASSARSDRDLRALRERRAPMGPLWPEVPVTAIRHATVLTVTNRTIAPGTIIIRDGTIEAVGRDDDVSIPAGAREIDAAGMFVMPGIVDAHIHIAVAGDDNESTGPVTPEVRIADVIDHRRPSILRALAGGVTTANVLHGSANVIGGQNAVIKMRWGKDAADLFVEGAQPGIKFALGENPKRSNRRSPSGVPSRYPATRMGVELTLRTSLTKAQKYQAQWKAYEDAKARGEDPMPPRRNLRLEALVGVLDGSLLVHAHCYRSDEILMLLRVAEDFGFRIASLQHVLEGYKVADEIAAHGAGASTFADNWGYKVEAFDAIPYNATLMANRGVVASINSDALGEMSSRLYVEAAKAMKYGGASEEEALKMVTLNPAKHLRLDGRIGSIEPGKDADLSIYTAHPFSADAQVSMTLVDGQIYFDRDKVETTTDALQALAKLRSEDVRPQDAPLTAVALRKLRLRNNRLRATGKSARRKSARTPSGSSAGAAAAMPRTVGSAASPAKGGGLAGRFVPWAVPEASPSPIGYGDVLGPALESSGDIAIVGGRVVTVAGPAIEGGTVLIRNGRIAAVGTEVDLPGDAEVIDARGLVVTPGIINAGTTLGITEIGAVPATQDVRELKEVNASVKVSVAVHPHSEMLPVTRANGVTSALTVPAGGLISGQAALIDMAGWTAPEVVSKSPVAMVIDFPEILDLLSDKEAKKASERVETDRKTLRDWMRRGRAYVGAIANGHTKRSEDDDELRALVPVVRGELPILLEADTEDGIRAALDFADEFGLDAILVGTRDVWRTVDAIAKAGVPVILGPIENPPAPGDPYDAVFTAASLLQDAGVPFCFRTGGATNARNLPYTAGMAVAFGLSREQAWHAMTKGASDILGVGEDYGSLEVGKVANVVVAEGDLLDVATEVRHVLIRGRRVDLSSRHTKLYEKFKARPLNIGVVQQDP